MTTPRKPAMSLYVDRGAAQAKIVRDREGQFRGVPPGEDAGERRQPFQPTWETELEAIPGALHAHARLADIFGSHG
jgi:hypothetical protein